MEVGLGEKAAGVGAGAWGQTTGSSGGAARRTGPGVTVKGAQGLVSVLMKLNAFKGSLVQVIKGTINLRILTPGPESSVYPG